MFLYSSVSVPFSFRLIREGRGMLSLGKEQPSTEQAPLVADDGVQGVAGIVNNVQQFVQCPLLCHCHQ